MEKIFVERDFELEEMSYELGLKSLDEISSFFSEKTGLTVYVLRKDNSFCIGFESTQDKVDNLKEEIDRVWKERKRWYLFFKSRPL